MVRHPNRDAVVIGGEDRVPYFYKMDRPRKMLIADDSTLIPPESPKRANRRTAGESLGPPSVG